MTKSFKNDSATKRACSLGSLRAAAVYLASKTNGGILKSQELLAKLTIK